MAEADWSHGSGRTYDGTRSKPNAGPRSSRGRPRRDDRGCRRGAPVTGPVGFPTGHTPGASYEAAEQQAGPMLARHHRRFHALDLPSVPRSTDAEAQFWSFWSWRPLAACSGSSTWTAAPTGSIPDGGVAGPADAGVPGADAAPTPSDAGIVTIATDAGTVTMTPLGRTAQTVGTNGGTIALESATLVVPAAASRRSRRSRWRSHLRADQRRPGDDALPVRSGGADVRRPRDRELPRHGGRRPLVAGARRTDRPSRICRRRLRRRPGDRSSDPLQLRLRRGWRSRGSSGAAALGTGAIDSCEQIITVALPAE